jgi:hypothetical protein
VETPKYVRFTVGSVAIIAARRATMKKILINVAIALLVVALLAIAGSVQDAGLAHNDVTWGR